MQTDVARLHDLPLDALTGLLKKYELQLAIVSGSAAIPGSYWGESEAGLVGDTLYVRTDTPVHSALHEAAHFVCMNQQRRERLQTDAGGDYAEENAVCYLQILWGDELADFGRARMCRDMDAWGYTFRLGSAQRWFEADADDARDWLLRHGVIDPDGRTTGRRREQLTADS